MLQNIKNQLNNIQIKLEKFNKVYIEYLLCITFLNLIILKINQVFLQLSPIYLYPVVISISVLFIKQWFLLTDQVKNTNIFNNFLYSFLLVKNGIYGLFFEYFSYVEGEKYQRLIIFLTGFVLSSWCLNILFFFLNDSYNVSILFFFLLLIINVFNLIEKKLIFTSEHLNERQGDIDYLFVKKTLKINNQTFTKNRPFLYIQKRYVHFNEIKNLIKKHGVTVITSATAGSLFTGYLQHSSVQVQKKQLELQKEQLELQREQFIYQKNNDKAGFIKWREELNLKKLKSNQKAINATDEKIGVLNEKIHKLQVDMDTRSFWNRVDFSGTIEDLRGEREVLKRRRSSFEEEMKSNQHPEISLDKKIKIDNNSFFDE